MLKQTKLKLTYFYLHLFTFLIFLAPSVSLALTLQYKPLVGIPGLTGPGASNDLGSYVSAIYALFISLAALLAVIKIIIAGVKWMMTDKIGSISEAKSDIQSALLGLIIIICAVLIINIINPKILS